MARPSVRFIRALVRYGNASEENLANISTWYDEAVAEIAAQKGGDIVSGSTNGSAFTKLASMTNAEWLEVLDEVQQHIEAGTTPQTRTIARLF